MVNYQSPIFKRSLPLKTVDAVEIVCEHLCEMVSLADLLVFADNDGDGVYGVRVVLYQFVGGNDLAGDGLSFGLISGIEGFKAFDVFGEELLFEGVIGKHLDEEFFPMIKLFSVDESGVEYLFKRCF